MSKKKKRNKAFPRSYWVPPKGYEKFFDASSDYEFKSKHPVGYWFLVLLSLLALVLPSVVFLALTGTDSGWAILGVLGGFMFGIGLFNFVAIIIKQYLGHWVSVISFALGGILMVVGYFLCK